MIKSLVEVLQIITYGTCLRSYHYISCQYVVPRVSIVWRVVHIPIDRLIYLLSRVCSRSLGHVITATLLSNIEQLQQHCLVGMSLLRLTTAHLIWIMFGHGPGSWALQTMQYMLPVPVWNARAIGKDNVLSIVTVVNECSLHKKTYIGYSYSDQEFSFMEILELRLIQVNNRL